MPENSKPRPEATQSLMRGRAVTDKGKAGCAWMASSWHWSAMLSASSSFISTNWPARIFVASLAGSGEKVDDSHNCHSQLLILVCAITGYGSILHNTVRLKI